MSSTPNIIIDLLLDTLRIQRDLTGTIFSLQPAQTSAVSTWSSLSVSSIHSVTHKNIQGNFGNSTDVHQINL